MHLFLCVIKELVSHTDRREIALFRNTKYGCWRHAVERTQQVTFHWPCRICCIPVPRSHFDCPVDDVNRSCTKVVLELHIWATLHSNSHALSLWLTTQYVNSVNTRARVRLMTRELRLAWHKGWLFQLQTCGCNYIHVSFGSLCCSTTRRLTWLTCIVQFGIIPNDKKRH